MAFQYPVSFPSLTATDIVDKTANFVARNGPEFEARIRQHEQNNPKFNFLNPGDPYHAYYQHKVNECRTGKTGQSLHLVLVSWNSLGIVVLALEIIEMVIMQELTV